MNKVVHFNNKYLSVVLKDVQFVWMEHAIQTIQELTVTAILVGLLLGLLLWLLLGLLVTDWFIYLYILFLSLFLGEKEEKRKRKRKKEKKKKKKKKIENQYRKLFQSNQNCSYSKFLDCLDRMFHSHKLALQVIV